MITAVAVNRAHPLSPRLHAAWVGTPAAVRGDLVIGDTTIGDSGGGSLVRRVTAAGVAWSGSVWAQPFGAPRMQLPNRVSLFWYGVPLANPVNAASANPALAVYYQNSAGGAPFVAYGLHRPNNTDVLISWNSAGTFTSVTATNVFSAATYQHPLSVSATYGAGSVRAYANGREVQTGAGVATITYSTGHHLQVNYNATGAANTATGCVYVFNGELTPTDHAQLALDPWALVTAGRRPAVGLAVAAVASAQAFIWGPL